MRLIDADVAIEVVHKWLEDVFCISSTEDEVTVFKRLRALPTVDAESVKHGRWVDFNPKDDFDPRMVCSLCKGVDIPTARWKYCPICGAKMDLEGEDDG